MYKTYIKRNNNNFRVQKVNRNIQIVSRGKRGPQGEPGANLVESVNAKQGVVVLHSDDISDTGRTHKFVTAAQLALIDAALQAGDNISNLVNDAGYIADLTGFTTSDLSEGSRLYYTNDRVDARITLQKGQADGLATLGSDGKIPTSQLPALAITDTFVVASQVAMLALTAEVGDVAVRTDQNKSYILKTAGASTLGNWQELLTPTDTVLSVNGQTGAVVLTTTNIAEGTNEYYTAAKVTTVGDGRYLKLDSSNGPVTNALTFSGDITVSQLVVNTSGTLSNPSIRWSAKANTGIFYSATDNINFTSNGGTKLTVNSSGIAVTGLTNTQGLRLAQVAKTAAYTIVSTDHTILADATSAAFNVTLPSASSNTGAVFTIKKTDSSGNAVTVVGTIDGATNYSLATQYKYVTVQSNGTNWMIVANN